MPSRPSRQRIAHRILCLLALCLALPLSAQTTPSSAVGTSADAYAPRTGDVWIDRTLRDIDDYAARYPDSFADEAARYLGISREYVQALLALPNWHAGDVHFACALARASAHACREVVRARAQDYGQTWRDVAKRLDVRPGSNEYRRVRASIRASYAHWARPLPE